MAEQSILIVLPTGRTMIFRLLFVSDTVNLGAASKMKENEGKSTLSKCITYGMFCLALVYGPHHMYNTFQGQLNN